MTLEEMKRRVSSIEDLMKEREQLLELQDFDAEEVTLIDSVDRHRTAPGCATEPMIDKFRETVQIRLKEIDTDIAKLEADKEVVADGPAFLRKIMD